MNLLSCISVVIYWKKIKYMQNIGNINELGKTVLGTHGQETASFSQTL